MNDLKPFKLLYAEDDLIIRQGYVNYFKTIFQTVYSASDGQEAFSLYETHKPDILLLDVNMPYLDGLSLVKKIRQKDKDVKIVILTAYLDEERLIKAIPLGLTAYLKKPIRKRELQQTLLNLVSTLELQKRNDDKLWFSKETYWEKNANALFRDEVEVHLTKNEIVLLRVLSSKTKIHYSLDEILEEFWLRPNQKEMSHNSIRNLIKRLKQKLPDGSIENHYAIGYKLCVQE